MRKRLRIAQREALDDAAVDERSGTGSLRVATGTWRGSEFQQRGRMKKHGIARTRRQDRGHFARGAVPTHERDRSEWSRQTRCDAFEGRRARTTLCHDLPDGAERRCVVMRIAGGIAWGLHHFSVACDLKGDVQRCTRKSRETRGHLARTEAAGAETRGHAAGMECVSNVPGGG